MVETYFGAHEVDDDYLKSVYMSLVSAESNIINCLEYSYNRYNIFCMCLNETVGLIQQLFTVI